MSGRMVALLRGINVGKAKRIAMAELRGLVEGLGYRDVKTLLNSGNVVFTAPDADARESAGRIEAAIAQRLGVSSRVTVITAEELAEVVTANPLGTVASDPSRLLVGVFNDPANRAKLDPLTQRDWTPDALAVGTRVAYLWCVEGVLASLLAKEFGRVCGDGVTSRNWSTIEKLHALAGGQQ
jgi:uncharacterized protein (DUF1697 family)